MSGEWEHIPIDAEGEAVSALAATPDGAVWFTLATGGLVCRQDPDGTTAAHRLPVGSEPTALAAATESAVWVADAGGNRLALFGAGPHTQRQPSLLAAVEGLGAAARPFDVVALDDGTAWFAQHGAAGLGRVGVLGQVDEFSTGRAGASVASLAGAGDSVWFTVAEPAALGHVRGGDAAVAFVDLPPGSSPGRVVVGADGSVWVALRRAGALARRDRTGEIGLVPLPDGAQPRALAADHDGGLWAGLSGPDALARVSPSGDVRTYPLPEGAGEPRHVAVGADGRVWCAPASGGLIAFQPR